MRSDLVLLVVISACSSVSGVRRVSPEFIGTVVESAKNGSLAMGRSVVRLGVAADDLPSFCLVIGERARECRLAARAESPVVRLDRGGRVVAIVAYRQDGPIPFACSLFGSLDAGLTGALDHAIRKVDANCSCESGVGCIGHSRGNVTWTLGDTELALAVWRSAEKFETPDGTPLAEVSVTIRSVEDGL